MNQHDIVRGISNPVEHIQRLKEEIEYLRGQIKEHATGHIHTTIGVLEERVRELSGWVVENY